MNTTIKFRSWRATREVRTPPTKTPWVVTASVSKHQPNSFPDFPQGWVLKRLRMLSGYLFEGSAFSLSCIMLNVCMNQLICGSSPSPESMANKLKLCSQSPTVPGLLSFTQPCLARRGCTISQISMLFFFKPVYIKNDQAVSIPLHVYATIKRVSWTSITLHWDSSNKHTMHVFAPMNGTHIFGCVKSRLLRRMDRTPRYRI